MIEVCDVKHVGSYECILKFKHGGICGIYFKSDKAPSKHTMKSLQHEETQLPKGCAFVCSNQCPWCFRILKNEHAAKSHVTKSLQSLKMSRSLGSRIKSDNIFFVNSVKLILTIWWSATFISNCVERLAHVFCCNPVTKLLLKFGLTRNSQEATNKNQHANEAIIIQVKFRHRWQRNC